MTTVMSAASSVTSPAPATSPSTNPNHPPLPALITSPPSTTATPPRRTNLSRPMSHASKSRLSQYSTTSSVPSRSRPPSHMFPLYPSSLPYALVRDFAYPTHNPLHYGPSPEPSRPPSGMTTPASESSRRLSDPAVSWSDSRPSWESWGREGYGKYPELAPIALGDGPPWSEDEDLQSPVVSSRHKKHKSTSAAYSHRAHHVKSTREERSASQGAATILNPVNYDQDRSYFAGTSGDGNERYYVSQGGEANGPGGDYVTYPPGQAHHSASLFPVEDQKPRQYDQTTHNSDSSEASSPGFEEYDESRYSRDYQFTITSPDEEMHGKAVALYDFERENENELPLVEGQIIWVSYRHGQGWLVAEDPKTQESGLVPEEYVRLLKDIEGGMSSLTGQLEGSPHDAGTPTQAEHNSGLGQALVANNAANGYHQPVVSTFSTSSKDLEPYPQHKLGPAGQPPPQVVHYHGQRGGSQANTPTLPSHDDAGSIIRRDSETLRGQPLETLPDSKLSAKNSQGALKSEPAPTLDMKNV